MGKGIITSSLLIILVILARRLFRKKIPTYLQYAVWLLVAIKLIVFPIPYIKSEYALIDWNKVVETRDDEEITLDNVDWYKKNYIEVDTDYYNKLSLNFDKLFDASQDRSSWREVYPEEGNGKLAVTIDNSRYSNKLYRTKMTIINTWKNIIGAFEDISENERHILAVIWLFGSLFFAAVFAIRHYRLDCYLNVNRTYKEKYNGLNVYVVPNIPTPCLFKSKIYMTEEIFCDEVARNHILRHEYTHYKHKDEVWSILRVLCLCMYWWNPLVILAVILSKRDCEIACDAAVIKDCVDDEVIAYGHTLISVARKQSRINVLATTTMDSGKRDLRERIEVISMRKKVFIFLGVMVVLGIFAAVLLMVSSKKTSNNEVPTEKSIEASNTDIFEKLGIQPYDESLLMVEGEEYFSFSDGRIIFNKKMAPQEPFCLVVPSTYKKQPVKTVGSIENVRYLVDLIYEGGIPEGICDCKNLKRIVYGNAQDDSVNIDNINSFFSENGGWMAGTIFVDNNSYPGSNVEELIFAGEYRNIGISQLQSMNLLTELKLPEGIVHEQGIVGLGITEAIIPTSVRVIDWSYIDCDNLRYAVVNEGTTGIYESFRELSKLDYVVLPKSITYISKDSEYEHKSCFYNCPNLTLVVEPSSYAEKFAKDNNIPYIYTADFDLEAYKKKIDYESYVAAVKEKVAKEAEYNKLNAMQEIYSDEEVADAMVIAGEEYFEIDTNPELFDNWEGYYEYKDEVTIKLKEKMTKPYKLVVPEMLEGKRVTGYAVSCGDNFICELEVPESVNIYAPIDQCINIRKITYGEQFISGPSSCPSLEEVDMSKAKIRMISGFFDVPKLKNIKIPETVELIANFEFCRGEEVVVPNGVKEIFCSFNDNRNIKRVILPDSLETITSSFSDCNNIESAVMPASIKEIADDGEALHEYLTFYGSNNITIKTTEGSVADKFAKKHELKVEYLE